MNTAFFDQDARNRVLAGAKLAYDVVRKVQGPRSGNVGIGHTFYGPDITHDGVTVLSALNIDDSAPERLGERIGVELMKEASRNVNHIAGDGTTTVPVLTYNILHEANKVIAADADPQAVRRGIDKAAELALIELEKHATPIKANSKAVEQVATNSASSKEMGKLIAEVVKAVGPQGSILVETDNGTKLDKEIIEGFAFDYGMASPIYATNQNTKELEYEYPAFVIVSGAIFNPLQLKPIIEALNAANQSKIVFILDEPERDVTHELVQHRTNGASIAVIKAPGHGEGRQEALADIAAFVGAKVLNVDVPLENATIEHVGQSARIHSEMSKTIIYEGRGKESTKARIKELEEKRTRRTASELDKAKIDERIAKLSSKAAIIKVGGVSETAVNEKKDKVDDAVAATQGALKEGIVAGGGVTLAYLAQFIQPPHNLPELERAGFMAFKKALVQPFRQILLNASMNADAMLAKVNEANLQGPKMGVDVMLGIEGLIDLKQAGVIDPIRVTREVIKQSASVAGTAATMDVIIVELPEKSIDNYA